MARPIDELQARLEEAEELLRAIRSGEVDSLVVPGPLGNQVYTLRGAEHPYRSLVEAMNEGAAILTADGVIVYANRSFAAVLDSPLDEVIGSAMDRFVFADDLLRYQVLVHHDSRTTGRGELRLLERGGRLVPVHLSINDFESGAPGSVCAVVTNLTEHEVHQELVVAEAQERGKRQEAKAGHRRVASILENITDSFFSLDRRWRITDANLSAAANFDITRADLVGSVFWNLFPRNRHPELEAQYVAAMTEHAEIHIEAPAAVIPDRWFEWHIYPTDDGLAVYFRDITERKHAESRAAYQAKLLASVHDAILATDDHLILTAWNAAAEQIYGWRADEVLGRSVGDVIRSDLTDAQRSDALKTLAKTGRFFGEIVQYTRDGRRICVEGHISVLQDDAGRVTGYVAANRDITERKRAEDELRRSEANLADAQHLSHTGSWTWNTVTGELRWSLEHYRIFGVDHETFRPTVENTQRLIHPHDFPAVQQLLEKAVRERRAFEVRYRIIRPDGSVRHHYGLGRPVDSGSGDLEYMGSLVDITDQKEAEEHLRRSESYLAEGQRISHTGSWARNVSTGELFWSLEHFRICGVDPETFTPTLERAQQLIHPQDQSSANHAFETASRLGGDFDHEFRFVRPDGTVRHVHSLARPVVNELGQILEYVGTIVDITERKQADLERAQLLRQIVQAQEDERRRIALEMHDQFGQQLSALALKLSALRQERGRRHVFGEQLASLETITRQLDTDLELIISRLRPPALDDLGLVAALTNYVRHWSQHFGVNANLHVTGMEPGRLTNEIDTALYRITQEALNNIAKHAKAENVVVLLNGHPNRVSLIVEDDGVGFDMQQAVGGGFRFGLVGMRERASLLGGTLDIESHPGRGATVVARIPVPASAERARV